MADSSPAGVGEFVRPTTVVRSPRLDERLGASVVLACETLQHTGSFKFRAAYNLAAGVPHQEIIAASSGNFGQALAYACRLLGKSCTVVMPQTSSRAKVEAVLEYGGTVDLIDTAVVSRSRRVAELSAARPDAYAASAYSDPLVIEGNASLGEEIGRFPESFEAVLVPIGGGGLASGIVVGLRRAGRTDPVVGAEPLLANDAARSIREGRLIADDAESATIADGARTLGLGENNWEILREGLEGIIEVPEEFIAEGVRLLFSLANLKAEPTGALSIAALLADRRRFAGKRVCCVVSGGNVDAPFYARILDGR